MILTIHDDTEAVIIGIQVIVHSFTTIGYGILKYSCPERTIRLGVLRENNRTPAGLAVVLCR